MNDPSLKLIIFIGKAFGCVSSNGKSLLEILWLYTVYPCVVFYFLAYNANCHSLGVLDTCLFVFEILFYRKATKQLPGLVKEIGKPRDFPILPLLILLTPLAFESPNVLLRMMPSHVQISLYMLLFERIKTRCAYVASNTKPSTLVESMESFMRLVKIRILLHTFFRPVITVIFTILSCRLLVVSYMLVIQEGTVKWDGLTSKVYLFFFIAIAAVQSDILNSKITRISNIIFSIPLQGQTAVSSVKVIYFTRTIQYYATYGRYALSCSIMSTFIAIITMYFMTIIQLLPQLAHLEKYFVNCKQQ